MATFTQIAQLGITDFKIEVKQTESKVSMILSPKTDKKILPIVVNFDSFEEMDSELINVLQKPAEKLQAIKNNLDEFEKSVDEAAKAPVPKKAPAKKSTAKAKEESIAETKEVDVPEGDLFNQPSESESKEPIAETKEVADVPQAVEATITEAKVEPVVVNTVPQEPAIQRVEPSEAFDVPAPPQEVAPAPPVQETPPAPPVQEVAPKINEAPVFDAGGDDLFASMPDLFA